LLDPSKTTSVSSVITATKPKYGSSMFRLTRDFIARCSIKCLVLSVRERTANFSMGDGLLRLYRMLLDCENLDVAGSRIMFRGSVMICALSRCMATIDTSAVSSKL
jgi:hypothetical protein